MKTLSRGFASYQTYKCWRKWQINDQKGYELSACVSCNRQDLIYWDRCYIAVITSAEKNWLSSVNRTHYWYQLQKDKLLRRKANHALFWQSIARNLSKYKKEQGCRTINGGDRITNSLLYHNIHLIFKPVICFNVFNCYVLHAEYSDISWEEDPSSVFKLCHIHVSGCFTLKENTIFSLRHSYLFSSVVVMVVC